MSNYREGTSKTYDRKRGLTAEEIRALFVKAGWIGEYRVPHPFLTLVPFFDRGPGVGSR